MGQRGEGAGGVDDGRPDDDDIDGGPDGDGGDDGDGEGGEGGDDGEYTPPTREEWDLAQRTLAARKQERNDARRELRELRAQLQDGGAGGEGRDAPDPKDEESAKWRRTAAKSSAAVQLAAAGFAGTAKQAKRLTALLDLEGATPDRDGDFDFEDEIAELAEEYPALFRSAAVDDRRPARRPTTADRGSRTPRDAAQDPTERTSQKLLRAAGVVRR